LILLATDVTIAVAVWSVLSIEPLECSTSRELNPKNFLLAVASKDRHRITDRVQVAPPRLRLATPAAALSIRELRSGRLDAPRCRARARA
jgi:hypothetical protein